MTGGVLGGDIQTRWDRELIGIDTSVSGDLRGDWLCVFMWVYDERRAIGPIGS
jgi:hypothetical protein